MRIDPSQFLLLLCGPKVAQLGPFMQQQGFQVVCCPHGSQGLAALNQQTFHAVLLEMELEDLTTRDFVDTAQRLQPEAKYLLLDDPRKGGMIVSNIGYIVDGYIPTPPDPTRMFLALDRILGGLGGSPQELEQLRAQMQRKDIELSTLSTEFQTLNTDLAALRVVEKQFNASQEKKQQTEAELEKLRRDHAALVEEAQKGGSGGLSAEELEEIQSKADFADFLEAENDELKAAKVKLSEEIAQLKRSSTTSSDPAGGDTKIHLQLRKSEENAAKYLAENKELRQKAALMEIAQLEIEELRTTIAELESTRGTADPHSLFDDLTENMALSQALTGPPLPSGPPVNQPPPSTRFKQTPSGRVERTKELMAKTPAAPTGPPPPGMDLGPMDDLDATVTTDLNSLFGGEEEADLFDEDTMTVTTPNMLAQFPNGQPKTPKNNVPNSLVDDASTEGFFIPDDDDDIELDIDLDDDF